MWKLFLISILLCGLPVANADYSPGLDEVVNQALKQNHWVQSSIEDSRAQKNMVTSKYNLPDPAIGIAKLDRGNETEYITIQQKVRFPTKYWLEGKAQKRLYESSQDQVLMAKLKLREDVASLYYKLFASQKTIELTKTNLQIVKDFARVAEKKYASGESTQSDSMKAHFEITQLEIDLLGQEQEEISLQSKFKALLGNADLEDLNLGTQKLSQPSINLLKVRGFDQKLKNFIAANSPQLRAQEKKLDAANYKKSLAKWEFAPDFNIQYQQRIAGFPEDSKIYSVSATFPLWFWKNSAKASHASAKAMSEEHRYQDMVLKMMSRFKSLKARIEKMNKTLLIYKTTLMPQADGAYRSSRVAYKAGKSSFLNLLDSERSLYQVKQNYYKALSKFVQDVTEMESLIGQPISNIYGIKGVIL